jgi:tetratricopeptide (TPR) repeat protein
LRWSLKMPNRTASTLSFCGRISELETLKARWRLARNIKEPSPQVVVVKAERGLGKTRLALEFYKWLRQNEGGYLTKSYWPDAVDIVDRNLDVNPEFRSCKSDVPIPYLWWGLRAADVHAENGVAADAIATYDRFLAPHLAVLKSGMVHYGGPVAAAIASVGIDFATSALHIDKGVSVVKSFYRTTEILLGAANKQMLNEAMDRPFSRSDLVLDDLSRCFNPGTLTWAKVPGVILKVPGVIPKVPGVILIDDAQFIHRDPALPSFVERLMHRSIFERWPVLIIVTHWRAQLSPELTESASSFAGILKHARKGLPTDLSPVYCLPGGYLGDDHFTEIDLRPLPDLSEALREKLPGLIPEQSKKILEVTGGNPRFLEQVILFLLENVGVFDGYLPDQKLTPEGFEKMLSAVRNRRIVDVVLLRLIGAPVEVQEAICLASLQGITFANEFVDQLARDILGRPVRQSLSKGEEPYSMLVGTKTDSGESVGQFAERLFHLVAEQHRQNLSSLGGEKALQAALEDRVKKVVRESDPEKTDYPEAIGLVCGIALNLFERAAKSEERFIAQRAASVLAYFELQRGSLESAAALYERLLAIKPTEPEQGYEEIKYFIEQQSQRIEILESLGIIYGNLGWPSRSAKSFLRLKWEAIRYLELPNEFVVAREKNDAAQVFENWRRGNPDPPAVLVTWYISKIVSACLYLSELALGGYHQTAAEGDEQLTPSSFGIVAYDADTDRTVEAPTVAAQILVGLAYAQDGVLGDGEAEKQHVWLLERLARQAIDRRQYDVADEYLQRALKIAENLKDDMFRLSVRNNLIVTFGQKGDLERAKKYLELAAPICNSYINEATFPVDLIMEDSGPDGRPVVVERRRVDPQRDQESSHEKTTGSRWIRRAHVPVRLSKEFDEHPEEVLGRDRTMMGVIASVFGNAGHRALAMNEVSKAKPNFSGALSIHEEIGDPQGAFHDLERLAHIAHIEGNREEVCANLRRCLALAPTLRRVDPRRWHNVEGDTRNAIREAGCTGEEATVASTDREPKQPPSSDHPL